MELIWPLTTLTLGLCALWWTRAWGHSRWRWGLPPQLIMIGVATVAADLGRIPPALVGWWPYADKVWHLFLVGGLAFWLRLWLGPRSDRCGRWPVPSAALFPLGFALIDEALQAWSPVRSLDAVDMLANLVGIIAGYGLARALEAAGGPRTADP